MKLRKRWLLEANKSSVTVNFLFSIFNIFDYYKKAFRLITISNIVNSLQMLILNLGVLAPIEVEILFIFSLKIKRLQRKAGNSSKKKAVIITITA
jgi:hypothetical protein